MITEAKNDSRFIYGFHYFHKSKNSYLIEVFDLVEGSPLNSICFATEDLLKEINPSKCISGLALGYDTWCAKICIKLDIPFIAAVPFKGQENLWGEDDKKEYNFLLDKAAKIEYISTGNYAAWKMDARNRWMVDNSDIIIACFNGSPGGTRNCIEYAKSKDKRIINVLKK